MAEEDPDRGTCGCCKRENLKINADRTIRFHLTDDPECHSGPDSRKCRGAGKPPAGEPEEGSEEPGTFCSRCRMPYALDPKNGKIRTHLARDGGPDEFCGGSGKDPAAPESEPAPEPEPAPERSAVPQDAVAQVEEEPDRRAAGGPFTVSALGVGDLFRRSGRSLLYRVLSVDRGRVVAVVAGPGPHGGRTGELTDPDELVTRVGPDEMEETGRQPKNSSTPATGTTIPGSVPGSTPSATAATERSSKVTRSAVSKAAGSGSAVVDSFLDGESGPGEDDLELDHYGRYLLPHPATGRTGPWTRATTFAKSIADTYALSMWNQRMVLKGAALRTDIGKVAFNLDVENDKDALNALCEDAKTAAGSKVAANLGTAVHGYTEAVDRAESGDGVEEVLRRLPEEHRSDVAAYAVAVSSAGFRPVPGLIEFTTAVTQFHEGRVLGVAGTSDRCCEVVEEMEVVLGEKKVQLKPGEFLILDVKTGKDLVYGQQEICVQLALYAHGLNQAGIWDRDTRSWRPPGSPGVPRVREDIGIIAHMPVDKRPRRGRVPAPCTLYAIDLERGWAGAVLCSQVRRWRGAKGLFTLLEVAETVEIPIGAPVVTGVSVRPPSWEDRFGGVASRDEAVRLWHEARGKGVGGADLKRLSSLAQQKLAVLVEEGG